ncbi:MAG: hypothetical protein A2667_00730 [Candidatus Wildermuthbacteria bacterium RIFCSPHIGHO2_01_FULL_47_27]|uniref:DUF1573 domain-containing protein n=1 Tax=Candidatus Wildermuthbacteria bacterium RIFCSPHIGHO2_02_FULL_47_17 TaxID=1802452 RepID=A0A1G2R3U2_9BACT|nr:MAG: hypothetical protein A2667_00730 [Candidatus Wildermuthbacteria bacterium RIFCSPHIGHO2_01_FULL_47_27]OHA67387.1 MAG: hypothetical protein A3D59_01320 [Candidatus Wildermuthbacteria bacterium RIFCSPHIGHO2_02_FULL_47_17]OHA76138.1 MAG: hypothetical protein A3I38_02795 [Candidatus Wildermuthbacteria bacterium RIFCSPLOWO2_02_FULL_47_10]
MNSNQIIILVGVAAVIALAVAGFVFQPFSFSEQPYPASNGATADNGTLPSGAILTVSEKTYGFGNVSMATGKVNHSFRLKNDGSSSLVVDKVYTSCMCTTAIFRKNGKPFGPFGMQGHGYIPSIKQTVEPGETVEVEVVFDPAAHGPAGVGYIERVAYLETSAGTQQLGINATVTP